jgi:hypothetical protein
MNERNDRRRVLAARMLPVQGVLLIVVAIIHLVMTAEIGRIVAMNTTPQTFDFLWPPYELDHIVVGVLLFAVGLIAMLCAGGIRDGDRRIWRIALVNALGVLVLSPAVALTVGLRYFAQAPAFLIAAVVLAIVGLWMTAPLLLIRRDSAG